MFDYIFLIFARGGFIRTPCPIAFIYFLYFVIEKKYITMVKRCSSSWQLYWFCCGSKNAFVALKQPQIPSASLNSLLITGCKFYAHFKPNNACHWALKLWPNQVRVQRDAAFTALTWLMGMMRQLIKYSVNTNYTKLKWCYKHEHFINHCLHCQATSQSAHINRLTPKWLYNMLIDAVEYLFILRL